MHIDPSCVWRDLQAIKNTSPLVHNITNFVVMEQTANCLLAIGAAPVMAHALEEVQDMARIASSVVLNLGTLSPKWVDAMHLAQQMANTRNIPVILDPVGAGATPYRTASALSLLNTGRVTAIRGNAAEIAALSGRGNLTRGVDSHIDASEHYLTAQELARTHGATIWMSGKTDVITDGESLVLVHNGHPLMSKVTGMGCTATAVLGAFLAINSDCLMACVHAAILMGIAGEIASQNAEGPGSFKLAFTDALFQIDKSHIEERMHAEI